MKQKLATWYKQKLWNQEMLKHAVNKGMITPQDYQEITGLELT